MTPAAVAVSVILVLLFVLNILRFRFNVAGDSYHYVCMSFGL